MSLKSGQQAPRFTLYDTTKNKISLDDLKGKKVVLLFFPFAFSSTCTKELCDIRDNIGLYNDLDAEVLGISVDSLYTLAKYKEDQRLNFTLLSDFNKEVSRAYDSIYETWNYNMNGVSKRSAFVIDREGKVQYEEVLDNASEIPNFNAVRAVLSSIN